MKKIYLLSLSVLVTAQLIVAQNGLTIYPPPAGYTFNQVREKMDFAMQNNNIGWFGFKQIGFGKFDLTSWTMYDSINSPLPSNTVNAVEIEAANNIWCGTNRGLAKFDGTNWTIYNAANSGLSNDTVLSLRFNGSDLWAGTKQGAFKFDGTSWTNYNTSNSGIAGNEIRSFAFNPNGEVWIGTTVGLSKFYNNIWTTTNFPTGNIVTNIEVDGNGNLWASTSTSLIFGANQVYKIENSQVRNFVTDIYTGSLPLNVISANTLCKNAAGDIFFIVYSGSTIVVKVSNSGINYFYTSGIVSSALGTRAEYDSNGGLWVMPRLMSGVNAFYNFNFAASMVLDNFITNDNFKYLDISDVKCGILNRGDMHWDVSNAMYTVPKNSGKNSVFASALWIGGLDAGNAIHIANQTYRQTGHDYWPGPIDGISIPFDSASCYQFDKIWKVDRFKVEEFKYYFLNGSVGNGTYPVPEEILTWPAKGNGVVTDSLAPFVDYNSDGIYDPYDGDYPLIKGDQMLWWVFNDSLAQHADSTALKLGFEIQASAYAYTCPTLPDSNFVMNWTTFYKYKIINKSPVAYHDVYLGLWSDMDLGEYNDDYAGCDSSLDAGFTYNGDNDDQGAAGYGLNPPMQNIKVLQVPLADMGDGLDNDHDGTIDEPGERCMMNHFLNYENDFTSTGNPVTSQDYYNYLRSLWKDSSFVIDCNGNITNYNYNGIPYSLVGCPMTFGGVIIPSDRRFVMSSGPFSLAPGQETTIDFAYVFTRDTTGPNGLTTSIARNIADLQRIKYWFDTDSFPSCLLLNVGINEQEEENFDFAIYPNPVGNHLSVFGNQLAGEIKVEIKIFDITGRNVLTTDLRHLTSAIKVNVSKLNGGLYILQLKAGDKMYRKKFVKG